MNALVLWIPGMLLIVIGALLFALGRLDLSVALAVIDPPAQTARRARPLMRVVSKE
jgi:hypothetical protein